MRTKMRRPRCLSVAERHFSAATGTTAPPTLPSRCRVYLLPARLRQRDAAAGGWVGASPCVRRCGSPGPALPSPFLSPRRFYVCL